MRYDAKTPSMLCVAKPFSPTLPILAIRMSSLLILYFINESESILQYGAPESLIMPSPISVILIKCGPIFSKVAFSV